MILDKIRLEYDLSVADELAIEAMNPVLLGKIGGYLINHGYFSFDPEDDPCPTCRSDGKESGKAEAAQLLMDFNLSKLEDKSPNEVIDILIQELGYKSGPDRKVVPLDA